MYGTSLTFVSIQTRDGQDGLTNLFPPTYVNHESKYTAFRYYYT